MPLPAPAPGPGREPTALIPAGPLPPRPVTEPQDAVLGILRLARALDSVDSGLSPQQYRILKLAGAGGERSARLAERLAVAKPTLTAIADSLVAAGLARREAEPGDRRVVRLHLTEAGLAAVERADAAYGQWLETILELSGNGDQIQADLRLMVGALEELRRRKKTAAASARAGDTTSTASTTSPATHATSTPDTATPDAASPDPTAPGPSSRVNPAPAGRP